MTERLTMPPAVLARMRTQMAHAWPLALSFGLGVMVLSGVARFAQTALAAPKGIRDGRSLRRVLPVRENELGAYALAPMFSIAEWQAVREAGVSMEVYRENEVTVAAKDARLRVREAQVSAKFFGLLGTTLAAGRYPAPDEASAALVSARVATRLYGRAEQAVGANVRIDGRPYLIVGVLGRGFAGLDGQGDDVWRLLRAPGPATAVMEFGLSGLIREDGASERKAEARVKAVLIARGARVRYVAVAPLSEDRLGGPSLARRTLPFVLLLCGALAALAAANGWLLIVRWGLSLRGDVQIRYALGAAPWRLAWRIAMLPAATMALAGAAAVAAGPSLARWLPSLTPRDEWAPQRSWSDAGVAALVMVAATAALLGYAMRRAGKVMNRSRTDGVPAAARAAVVAAYVGTASALGVASVPVFMASAALGRLTPGFETDHLVVVTVATDHGSALRLRQIDDALDRMRRRPSVAAAAASIGAPFGAVSTGMVAPDATGGRATAAYLFQVRGDVLGALGLGLLTTDSANTEWERGALVSRTLSERWQLRPGSCVYLDGASCTIVLGVVADIAVVALGESPFPTVYAPMEAALPGGRVHLLVRLRTKPQSAEIAGLEREVEAAFPLMAVRADAMRDLVLAQTAPLRAGNAICAALLALGVVLGSIGLRASTHVSVVMRQRELGIRAALGASPARLVAHVLRESAGIGLAALLFGLFAGFLGSRALASIVVGLGRATVVWQVALAAVAPTVLVLGSVAKAVEAGRREPIVNLRLGT